MIKLQIFWGLLVVFSILAVGCAPKLPDFLSLVEEYEEEVNANGLEGILTMYAEEAQIIIWPGTFESPETIQAVTEYCIGLKM